jgi:hypothetical protein
MSINPPAPRRVLLGVLHLAQSNLALWYKTPIRQVESAPALTTMRFDFVALPLAALAALLVPALARRSRLVTRGLDVAVPLPTARSGGANGQGILTQCPLGTTACARHKHHDRNDGGASMSSTRPSTAVDCIDTEVDFRSCACPLCINQSNLLIGRLVN